MTVKAHGAGPALLFGAGPSLSTRPERRLSAGDIFVTETIGGVSVTQRLSSRRFAGVLAACRADDPAQTDISLLGVDGRAILLATVGDAETVATWRGASRRFGLPMIIRREDGSITALEAMMGSLMRGKAHPGRRLKSLTRNRRPRFLAQRKTARLPLCPVVHGAGASGRLK